MQEPEIQRVIRNSAERERTRQAEEVREQYVRIFAGIYEKASAYTQAIAAGAYAAAFGVWAFTRDLLGPTQHALIGLLLLVSILCFGLWEVWVNIQSALRMRAFARRLMQEPTKAVAAMEAYERAAREQGLESVSSWAIVVVVSLATALTAFAIMALSLALRLWSYLGVPTGTA